MKDRARKPIQQIVNSCRTNTAGEWVCPSNPRGMNDDLMPATLPEQGTSAFCVNCGRVGHVASDCITPHSVATEEQVKAAWYAPVANRLLRFRGSNKGDLDFGRRRPVTPCGCDLW